VAEDLNRKTNPTGFLVKFGGALVLLALFAFGLLWMAQSYIKARVDPDPVTIATASIAGLREQNRLSAFQASYVAVVTSKQTRLGFTAERTIVMPGTVDYSVDLSKLTNKSVVWDKKTRTLGVTLPPVEVSPPRINLSAIREFGQSGVLSTFTDAGKQLDEVNRAAGQKELVHQAMQPAPLKLARDATRRAVEQSFSLPLKAAGVDATVKVRFAGEEGSDEVWDMSAPVPGVNYNNW
jgi:hypothetical protein